ncbi:MAG: DUF1501 domain-containing protein [Actinomycetota bacterium]
MSNEVQPPAPAAARRPRPSRRQFLTIAGCGALGAAGASLVAPRMVDRLIAAESTTQNYGPTAGGRTRGSGGADPGLVLVSVQLSGGVDFLNAVVPLNDPRYGQVRSAGTLDVDRADTPLTRIDDAYALHAMPYLGERWAAGELAIVHGVGWEGSSLSHFDATDMWEKGSPDFGTRTGWIGRALGDLAGAEPDPLLGLSMGGISPTMYADGWSPVGLEPGRRIPWSAAFVDEYAALDAALREQPVAAGSDLVALARNSQLDLRGLGARLGPIVEGRGERNDEFTEEGDDVEDTDGGYLDTQLSLVADLINGGIPTRAFHVSLDGFDTHANQAADLPRLLGEVDAGIRRFHHRLGPAAERVVVATWTEFGRRPDWNGDGTEHGTAGVQFVVGPRVSGGHHGEPPPLDRFDADDNFIVTTDFRDYVAGLTLGAVGADPAVVGSGLRGPLELIEA